MPCLLGIDLGTTTLKTAVVDAASGRVLAAAEREHPIEQPGPGLAEQAPATWWRIAVETTRRALAEAAVAPESVRGIGLSGQMHGTVCVDASGAPIRPAIIWADTRSSQEAEALRREIPPAEMAAAAPGLPAAGFMGPTLRWLAEHEPETLARTAAVLLPKDALRLMLTGAACAEPSDAASTWLFDIRRGEWSDTLLAWCGADRQLMPPVVGSGTAAGVLTGEAARALGLPAGLPVAAGAADMAAQALGYGLVQPGRALAIFGTGGQIFNPLDRPAVDPALRWYVFNHAVPGRWYAQAAILAAGLSLRWLRDLLNAGDYDRLSALAAEVPPGAEGLIFLPYLAGERTPHLDPAARGVFLGLRLHHGPGHLARAVMEGVTFALSGCLALVTGPDTAVLASGGATKSALWRQIMADIFGRPVGLAGGAHHAPVGAALLAGVAAGLYTDVADACAHLPAIEGDTIQPDPARAAFYAGRAALFHGLYDRLRDDMHALS